MRKIAAFLTIFGLAVVLDIGCPQSTPEDKTKIAEADKATSSQTDETEKTEEGKSARSRREALPRNEPVRYSKLGTGKFAILVGDFRTRAEAEQYSRDLRKKRVNNYILERSGEQYLVLVGSFYSQSDATRQMKELTNLGLNKLEIFSE